MVVVGYVVLVMPVLMLVAVHVLDTIFLLSKTNLKLEEKKEKKKKKNPLPDLYIY